VEFNKRLKALEKARAHLDRKRARLDQDLVSCREVLMPLVEKRNHFEYQLIHAVHETRKKLKLSKRRNEALDDLIALKIESILDDPAGLSEDEIAALDALLEAIAPPESEEEDPDEYEQEAIREEFDLMRGMLEEFARRAGVKLDLDGLDPNMDPAEFEEEMQRRFAMAGEDFQRSANDEGGPPKRKRKPTKAALERERLRVETEEAKKRDFKSLYKQLAKVLHPDLETDPTLKQHKEEWMKRLTAANASGDLHSMLAIEMEWLGEESVNLTKATDEKLRVYSMVLKEQIDELKEQSHTLIMEPEYSPLHRFIGYGNSTDIVFIQMKLQDQILGLSEMLAALHKGGAAARDVINRTADHHARSFGF
jgi:hypothetical protein